MKFMHYKINLSDPSSRRALVDIQDFHRNVQRLFGTSRAESQVLYRIHGSNLYISANKEPVEEISGLSLINTKDIKMYKSNDIHRFNILTQPYKKQGSKRIPLTEEFERLDWLNSQAQKHGFSILTVRENGFETFNSSIKSKENNDFSIKAFCYDGLIKVEDEKLFNDAIASGIGASKAYGLGMLLVV